MNLLDIARSVLAERSDQGLTRTATAAGAPSDLATERRRARALALLAEHPNWRRVVVAEAGDPVILGVAIRSVAYGEITLPENFDPRVLLALLAQYDGAPTVH